METNKAAEKTIQVKAFGRIGRYRVMIESDGTVRVWDSIAGYYTRCHGMTPAQERRIARSRLAVSAPPRKGRR